MPDPLPDVELAGPALEGGEPLPSTAVVAGVAAPVLGDDGAVRRRLGIGAWIALAWLVLVVLAALLAPVLPLPDPNEVTASIARQGPFTNGHLLGGDANGRDLLARLVWGGRASLLVGFGAIAFGGLLGGFLGIMAGHFRGRFETIVTGAFDVMLAFPQLILALAIVSFMGQSQRNLVLALGIVSTPILGRIVRASSLSYSQREFVTAAKALGATNRRIIWSEILPNVLPSFLSIALLGVAVVIVAEGGLSILGIGVPLPTPSWGNIIAEGRTSLSDAPHIVFAGSAMIFLTVLALNYLGDAVLAFFDVRESKA